MRRLFFSDSLYVFSCEHVHMNINVHVYLNTRGCFARVRKYMYVSMNTYICVI